MSRAGAAVVVGLALSGLVVAGEVAPVPAEAPGAPRAVSVVGTDVVCPDLRQVDPVLRTRVSAGVVQGPGVQGPGVQGPSGAGEGTAQAQALSGDGPPVPLALTTQGQVAVGLAQSALDVAVVGRRRARFDRVKSAASDDTGTGSISTASRCRFE